jgi:hypothetical protein
MAHDAGDESLPTRPLQRLGDGQEEADGVDGPDAGPVEQCVGEQACGEQDLGDAAEHQHLAPVDVVG